MYTDDEIDTAMEEHVGDAISLLVGTESLRWFNDGQARLDWWRARTTTLTFAAAATTVDLPDDFVELDRIVPDSGNTLPPGFRIFGLGEAVIQLADGAPSAFAGTMYYWGYWPDVSAAQDSLLPRIGDAACISYALHRFYRKLASSRTQYKRYSTLLGQNAIAADDLAVMAQDHYTDFLDLRSELPSTAPVAYFNN